MKCSLTPRLQNSSIFSQRKQTPLWPRLLPIKGDYINNILFPNEASSSQLSRSDMEKLACLVFYYGGQLQLRLDQAVSHLITMDTTGVRPPFSLNLVKKRQKILSIF